MPTAAERSLRATTYAKPPTRLQARVIAYERAERLRRAAAITLPLLGAALVSLFIPVWHLIGVPGFLVAAVVLGRARFQEAAALESLDGTCPACDATQSFEPPAKFELPVTLRCPGCSSFVRLEA